MPGTGRLPQLQVGPRRGAAFATAFDLVPENAGNSVPFRQALSAILASNAGAAQLEEVIAGLGERLGVQLPDPADLTANDILQLTIVPVRTLRAGAVAVNEIDRRPPRPKAPLVPSGTAIDDPASVEVQVPSRALTAIAPGVWRGWAASSLDESAVKARTVLASVFSELARNPLRSTEPYVAEYAGARYDDLGKLLEALRRDGHTVELQFEQRIADFIGLYLDVAGERRPVAAPLIIDTGLKGADGTPVLIPAGHSEMHVTIAPPPGGKIAATLAMYQGTGGTGFWPHGLEQPKPWVGRKRSAVIEGDDAWRGVRLAAQFAAIIESIAARLQLKADGYGYTGVCDDTAAILQRALTGTTAIYPLLNDRALLQKEVAEWRQAGRGDAALLVELAAALASVPSDIAPSGSEKERVLASLPWPPGKETLVAAAAARKALAPPSPQSTPV